MAWRICGDVDGCYAYPVSLKPRMGRYAIRRGGILYTENGDFILDLAEAAERYAKD